MGFLPQCTLQSFCRCLQKTRASKEERVWPKGPRSGVYGMFTLLVLSSNGGMGKEATTSYKRLADMIAQKRNHDYSMVMGWLRCRISLPCSGAQSVHSWEQIFLPLPSQHISLAATEGHVPPTNYMYLNSHHRVTCTLQLYMMVMHICILTYLYTHSFALLEYSFTG